MKDIRGRIYFLVIFALLVIAAAAWGNPPEPSAGLVKVADVDPNIIIDLRYATTNNFTGQIIYPSKVCLLRASTAAKLAAANAELMERGYRIKIWDAYRPPSVQQLFWNLVPDSRYVANPATGGSRHNRGGAVDLTLVDANGRELSMPSGFDDFSARASRDNRDMSAEAAANLAYLTQVMVKHGFNPIASEWWHFEDKDAGGFPMVEVSLEDYGKPEVLNRLPLGVRQVLLVKESSPGSATARLTIWEYRNNSWHQPIDGFKVMIGKNGFAAPGQKREGDGKSPSGIYDLGMAFGYPAAANTAMSYRQATEDDYWVDDPSAPDYNHWVHGLPKASSYERMKRKDDMYKYGLVVEYNTKPVVPFLGSAIFVHIWRGPDIPTIGCVAMPEESLVNILAWLDPEKKPVIIMGEQ